MIARLALLVGAFTIAVPPAAHAASDIDVIWGGRGAGVHTQGTLFDPDVLWVPGDVRTASLQVRNDSTGRAKVGVLVGYDDPNRSTLGDAIHLAARAPGTRWVALDQTDWTDVALVPAGQQAEVEVRARFEPAATNRTQGMRLALTVEVLLTQDVRSPGPPTGDGHEPGESASDGLLPDTDALLPDTGAPAVLALIGVASLSIGVGLGLLRKRYEGNESV